MKTTKRIIAVLLSLLMAFSYMSIAASADETEESTTGYETIALGEAKEVVISTQGETAIFEFVPENDGTYYFWSDSQKDTYGTVYDKDMTILSDDDDNGTDANFLVTYDLTGGKTYYLESKFLSSSSVGSFWVVIADRFSSSHDFEEKTTPPTCDDQGYTTYTCSRCGYSYDGNYTDATNHNIVDGACSVCGLECKTIAFGDIKEEKLTDDAPTVIYTFVPEETGTYVFWADSVYTAYCYAYDKDMNSVASDSSSYKCVTCDLEAGETYYLVVRCNHTVYALLSDTCTSIHDMKEKVKAPTCEAQGYTTHTCTRCGYSLTDTYVDALGHDYVDGICSRCGLGCEEIVPDSPKEVTVTGSDEKVMFSFTPTETATYNLWIDTDSYAAAYVYDSDLQQLKYGYFNYSSLTNKISYTFTAGQTYYISVRSNTSGTITFYTIISKSFTRDHDLGEEVKTEATTCGEQSYTTQICTRCGYKYTTYDSALEHTFKDGVCTRCGKVVNTISPGDVKKAIIAEPADEIWYSFTPEESGSYCFWADSASSVYTYLYNSDRTTCCSSSYSSPDKPSCLSYSFEADTTYYFKVKFSSSTGIGAFYALLDDEFTTGHDGKAISTTAPTCTSEGYTVYACSRCGYTYDDDYTDALGHNIVDGVCTRCGSERSTISLGETKNVKISESGETALFEFKPETSGTYYFWSDSPYDTYGTVYDNDMNQLAYDDDDGDENNFVVCYDFTGGKTYYLEARYFSGYTGSFTVLLTDSFTRSHDYIAKETVAPTCSSQGYTRYVCSRCNYSYTDYIDALGHELVDGVCSRCGSAVEDIAPGDVKEVTVSKVGETAMFRFIPEKSGRYYFWLDCSEYAGAVLYDSDMNQLTGVSQYGSSEYRICYTFLKGETYWFTCGFDSASTGSFYAILSDSFTSRHVFDAGTEHSATCVEKGYTEYVCSRCGYSNWEEREEATGHNFENGVCTRCGCGYTDISVGEALELTDIQMYDNRVLRFIPENDGTYYFWPDISRSVTFCLYDSDQTLISKRQYDCWSNSFISYNFEAGSTYYFTIGYLYETDNGRAFAVLSDDYSSNHAIVADGEFPAACLNEGGKGTLCSRCGYMTDYAEATEALGHNFENGVCTRCGEVCEYVECDITKTITAEANNYTWISFTPTVDGNYHFGLAYSGKYVEYGLYKNNDGLNCYAYNENYDGSGLDCNLEAGTEYVICVFDYEDDDQNIEMTVINSDIANCDHDIVNHDGQAATCTEDGREAYETCTKCAYTTYKAIPATGHTPAEAVKENETAATCTAEGSYDSVVYCSSCSTELSRNTVTTPATGHTPAQAVKENETTATCTAEGSYDSVVYCSVCKAELSRETIKIPMAEHKDDNRDGYCDVCGTITDEALINPCLNAKINVAVAKNFDYRTKVTIKATATGVPAGYYLAIYIGGNQVAKQEGGSDTTEVSYYAGEIKSDINYTVKIVDAAGNVQKDGSGKDLSKDAGTVKSVKNIIKVIVAFFKGLFGSLPSGVVKPQ